jgi:sulfite exporter TauE/SafE
MIDYGLILLTGVLTGLHCVGMCGAIVLAYSVAPAGAHAGAGTAVLKHVAYNGGRILSYAALGAMIGLAGISFSWIERAGEVISIVGGVIMVVGGLAMLGFLPFAGRLSLGSLWSGSSKLQGGFLRKRTAGSSLMLGLLTPLLPCGILYAMLAKAATAGGAVPGALTMGVFGAGMAPALMTLGGAASFFSGKVRQRAEVIAACLVMLMGVILILRGFHVPYAGAFPVLGGSEETHSCCSEE